MRRLLLALTVTVVVGGTTAGAAPYAVPGKLVGAWTSDFNTLRISSGGRVLYIIGGAERVSGTVSGTSTRATFGPAGACAGKGTYGWKVNGLRLTFKLTADRCFVRRNFLRTTWTRK
jgi:hypothetical protein